MNRSSAITVADWSFSYSHGPRVLDGVSFSLEPGERAALTGPNGAGKTTLLLGLAGVLPVPPGVIHVSGLDPAVGDERRRFPGQVGFCFQDPDDQLLFATLADDVAFGPRNLGWPPDHVNEAVRDAIARVGLTGLENEHPCRLSGGQKRRAAFAGVLAMRPNVILLDEPTSFLDARGCRDLVRLLAGIDATVVIATHDLEFVRVTCRRMLILDCGRVVADDAAATLLDDDEILLRHGLIAAEADWMMRTPK